MPLASSPYVIFLQEQLAKCLPPALLVLIYYSLNFFFSGETLGHSPLVSICIDKYIFAVEILVFSLFS